MKSSLTLVVVSAIAFLFSQTYSHATEQPPSSPAAYIEFTPVRLSVGMPKDRTIATMSEYYTVSPWKGGDIPDSWAVSEKSGIYVVTGLLSFMNGVLVRAARYWHLDNSAYSLAHTISLLMDHMRDEGFTHCTISTRKDASPTVESELLGIDCGQKGIIVQADQNAGKEILQDVQVMENLQAEFLPRR